MISRYTDMQAQEPEVTGVTTIPSTPYKLMVIDDNSEITDIIGEVGKYVGFDVTCVNEYDSIRPLYRRVEPHLIFLDLDLGLDEDMEIGERGFDGLDILQFVSTQKCKAPILIVSGSPEDICATTIKYGRELGLKIVGSLRKPFTLSDLEQIMMKFMQSNTSKEAIAT